MSTELVFALVAIGLFVVWILISFLTKIWVLVRSDSTEVTLEPQDKGSVPEEPRELQDAFRALAAWDAEGRTIFQPITRRQKLEAKPLLEQLVAAFLEAPEPVRRDFILFFAERDRLLRFLFRRSREISRRLKRRDLTPDERLALYREGLLYIVFENEQLDIRSTGMALWRLRRGALRGGLEESQVASVIDEVGTLVPDDVKAAEIFAD